MSEQDANRRPPEDQLVRTIGALVFASGETVHPQEILQAFKGTTNEEIDAAIEALQRGLEKADVGLRLERVAGGYRLATRSDVGAWVRQFFRQRNRTRLSPAALETLAIVAYRQPVTSPEIQAIRGRDPGAALRNLVDKRLLRILGKKKVVGNPLLYGTSKEFLVHFGLDSLEDLPSIEDFDEFLGAVEGMQTPLFHKTEGAEITAAGMLDERAASVEEQPLPAERADDAEAVGVDDGAAQ